MASSLKSIAVLGAGVTGLVAAHRLTKLGHRIRIFERTGRAGGVIQSAQADGWLIEAGPNSLLSGEPAVANLIDEIGLSDQVVHANPSAKNRFVVRDGRLVPIPLSPSEFISSGVFSPIGKLRMLSDLLARPRVRTTDLPLSEFVRGHFGDEFVDYGLNPFVAGVYAGNPSKLSARYAFPKLWQLEQQHGSLIRGQSAESRLRKARGLTAPFVFSFRRGMQTLTDTLGERLPVGCIAHNALLEAITRSEDKWNVIWNQSGATHTQSFDAIVVALPAPALAQLRVGALGERPLAALDGVEHPPVASLFVGFRRDQITHPLDGFGVLVPAVENRTVLGVLFSSTIFPDRAPRDHVALTVMIGGTRRPELAALPVNQLLVRIRPDLEQLLGVRGEPVFLRHTFWPRAIPQYNLGHEQYVSSIALLERNQPRLAIGGQVRDGISVPACIAAGEQLALRVTQ